MIKDDLINLEDGEYFVLEVLNYKGNEYAFVNQIGENDESLNVYKVITKNNDNYIVVVDENILNILLPVFEEKITSNIKKYQENN